MTTKKGAHARMRECADSVMALRLMRRFTRRAAPLGLAIAAIAFGCAKADSERRAPAGSATGTTAATAANPPSATAAPASTADVVSGASEAWTGATPKVSVTGDSVDGNALRQLHTAHLKTDLSAVRLIQGGSARELGARICEMVVPRRPAATPVLLKPNLGGFEWFKDPKTNHGDNGVAGRTTDPEFVRGVIQCLKARGHTRITVAEGWGATHKDWERLIQVSGYDAMTKAEGVPLVAMDDDGVFNIEGTMPGKPLGITGLEHTQVPTLLMPKILAEHLAHGLYLSLPKIKAHRFGVVSAGIKGMQGTIMYSDAEPAFKQKWRSHRELSAALEAEKSHAPGARQKYVDALTIFATRMVDVLELEAPDAVLAEGAPAMSGDGFRTLIPSAESVAIGGTNAVTVDKVAAQFLGLYDNADLGRELLGHSTSPLIEVAAKRFSLDLSKVVVIGDGAALLQTPRPVHFTGMAGFELSTTTAPATVAPATVTPAPTAIHEAPANSAPSAVPLANAPEDRALHAAHTALAIPTIALDGAAVSDALDHAPRFRFDTDYRGQATSYPTDVRALWNDTGLIVRATLQNAGLHTDQSRPLGEERAGLYQEDCFEFFLAPNPALKTNYAEIEIGPFGHYLDLWVREAGKSSTAAWSANLRIHTARDTREHSATIVFATTAAELRGRLSAGATLPIGLFRMEGTTARHYLAAFPARTRRPNFHVPEAFGALLLNP
jgi:uncharacterized protein (DUF362 family)